MAKTTPTQRNFRITNVLTFPPAFVMLLIHGIVGGGVFPAVALMPLAISALLGLYLINPGTLTAGGSSIRLADMHVVAMDGALAIWLIVMCVCCWLNIPRYQYDGGQIMLGTYGSVWVMMNCAIHTYFVLIRLPDIVALFASPCPKCGKTESHSHMDGQRRFRVQNGYVQLARDESLPQHSDDGAGVGASSRGHEYQRLP